MRINPKHAEKSRVFVSFLEGAPLVLAVVFPLLCCQSTFVGAKRSRPNCRNGNDRAENRASDSRRRAGSNRDGGLPEATDRIARQLAALQQQMAAEKTAFSARNEPAVANAASLEEIRERQAIEESQIATHDVTKVETESKYPLRP